MEAITPAEQAKEQLLNHARELGVFDPAYFCQHYTPQETLTPLDAFERFNTLSAAGGCHGSPHFDCDRYLEQHKDVAAASISPALHYLVAGHTEGRRRFRRPRNESDKYHYLFPSKRASCIFNPAFVRALEPGGDTLSVEALFDKFMREHAVDFRAGRYGDDWRSYSDHHKELGELGYSPAEYFLFVDTDLAPSVNSRFQSLIDEEALKGAIALRLVDLEYCRRVYPRLAQLPDFELFCTVLTQSRTSSVNASPLFDAALYLRGNPDIAMAGIGAIEHYLFFGNKEGRARFRAALSSEDTYSGFYANKEVASAFDLAAYRAVNTELALTPDDEVFNRFLIRSHTDPEMERYVINRCKERVDYDPTHGYSPAEFEIFFEESLTPVVAKARPAETRFAAVSDLAALMATAIATKIFDPIFYRARYALQGEDIKLFQHFLINNAIDMRNGSPEFDFRSYINNYDVDLVHYPSAAEFYLKAGRFANVVAERESYPPLTPNDVSLTSHNVAQGRFAVVLHIYYADYIDRFAAMVGALPFSVDLFITTPFAEIEARSQTVFGRLPSIAKVRTKLVANRGRNFGPWMVHFGRDLLEYDCFCHMHSKKSLYTGREQSEWSTYIQHYLLGDVPTVKRIVDAFTSFHEWGVVYPETYWKMPWWAHHWLKNEHVGRELSHRLGVPFQPGFVKYPVGGMFWARPAAIRQLLEAEFTEEDFPPELGQTDGTIQHAIERIIGPLCEQNGFRQFAYSSLENLFRRNGGQIAHAYYNNSYAGFEHYADRFQVLSLDIFDTIVYRERIWTEYAKWLVGRDLTELGWAESPEAYIKYRNETEMKIRIRRKFRGDVELTEILSEVGAGYSNNLPRTIVEREFDYDLSLFRAREEMVDIVNRRLAQGKRTIFVSDTVYSAEQIRHALTYLGVKDGFGLYVSSAVKARKDNATIWPVVVEKERVPLGQFLHAGDNLVSDIQIPTEAGLATFTILNAIDRCRLGGLELGDLCNVDSLATRELFGGVAELMAYYPFFRN